MHGVGTILIRLAGLVGLAAVLAASAACQDQRDAFNPVRLICPGEFDPTTSTCRIDVDYSPTR